MLTNYVLVLANTGIRVGEARNLKWSDIDTFVGDDDKETSFSKCAARLAHGEVFARTLAVKDYLQRIGNSAATNCKQSPQ